jgi:uncharacterized protein (TIGR00369 family)
MEVLGRSPFSSLIGPIEVEWEPSPVFETVVREECANSMGRMHGGFLAGLIDITAGQGVKRLLDDGRSLVTATTNTEYLAAARVGDRLRVEVTVDHNASSLVFGSCRVSTEDRLVAIASVVFSARPGIAK